MKKIKKTIPLLLSKIHYKFYPRIDHIDFPKNSSSESDLVNVLTKRKSVRKFSDKPITKQQISNLLFYSTGVIRNNDNNKNADSIRRSYPSAGARYPIETYVLAFNCKSLSSGIYHYNVLDHKLDFLLKGDYSKEMIKLCRDQKWIGDTGITIVLTGVFNRNMVKYKKRGLRYIFMEAGHIGQNIYLVAEHLNLGCCAIGGFKDQQLNDLLDVDGDNESALYILGIGTV